MDLKPFKKSFELGGKTVTLETGRIARQATGSVLVTVDDISVLGTVVGAKEAKPGQPFFPLTVNYFEKTYAVGKIPGGFFKREGRPSEKETLTSRLIDRPIRPLFPNGFMNEVQVITTVMSSSKNQDPDIAAMLAAFMSTWPPGNPRSISQSPLPSIIVGGCGWRKLIPIRSGLPKARVKTRSLFSRTRPVTENSTRRKFSWRG